MIRYNNLYQQICSIENLEMADLIASKGKGYQVGVKKHRENQSENILALREMLINKTYRTSSYTTFTVREPKERLVYRLPYFPDRITHHAVMRILEPIFVATFTTDTYSCIKKKGIHAAANGIKNALRDVQGTKYCLKLDITKFYPSVDHSILKQLLRRKFKDRDLLWLLDEIIDSSEGLPIGNYLSQYFANFYLSYFDHWIKEVKGVKYYFRYADDLVILSHDKNTLHALLGDIQSYLLNNLNLRVKKNYAVFPVEERGIDFVGYVFRHGYTRLRKSIKQNFARMMAKRFNPSSMASYLGWAKHADCKNLIKKIVHGNKNFQRFRDQAVSKTIRRRKDEDKKGVWEENHHSRIQATGIEISGKGRRKIYADSFQIRRRESCG